MKSKKTTFLLIVAVIIIWGMIIRRDWGSFINGADEFPAVVPPKKEPFDDYSIKKDTTPLLITGRDPFGISAPGIAAPTEKKTVATALETPILKPVKPPIDWSFVTYAGYIKNPATKSLIAILSINGKKAMLAEGEIFERVKLLKNAGDSVKISFQGAVKYIKLHSEI